MVNTDPDNRADPGISGGGKDASVLRERPLHRFRIDSIRGRYLLAAGLFVVFVLVAGWLAQGMVNESTRHNTSSSSERELIIRLLNDISDDIWLTETVLQGFLLTPDRPQRSATLDSFDHLLKDTQHLASQAWTERSASRRGRVAHLEKQILTLRQESHHLMTIRSDANLMFPAMRHMIDKMLPNHETFISMASLAMLEAEQQQHLPRQMDIYKLFAETRYAWIHKIGAFRLMIANRFGVFPGDPEQGMKGQAQQIEFYQEMVDRHLNALSGLADQQLLEFQQTESLARMREISRDWYHGYQSAAAIYSSERWRMDVPLLRDTIRPLFAQIWVDLGVLRGEVESTSASDIASLTNTANQLSGALWLVLFVTLALVVAGYLLFEYTIRRPIAAVAIGMKAEAQGADTGDVFHTSSAETRDLIEAFDHMRAQVRSRQQRLQLILDNTAEGIVTFDRNGTIEGYNQAAMRLFGWQENESIGQNVRMLVRPEDANTTENTYLASLLRGDIEPLQGQEGELTGVQKNGGVFPMAIKISTMQLEGRPLFTALVADISERKAMVEHLRQLAEHDDLTGLHNRSFFLHELERVVNRVRRSSLPCTLLYIDLDNFKYVNDTLGHLAGDRLLVEVSQLLRKRTRRGDLLARLGGDEFTMLLYDTRMDEAYTIADSFRKAMAEYRFRQASAQIDLGCSIGAAIIDADTRSAQEVLSRADFACHLAKRGGRNQVHVFDQRDEANVAALTLDMGWTRRIKDGIEQNRFLLARQPIVSLGNRGTNTYEILVRLRDEHDRVIMPNGFFPSAERFGLTTDIDLWVITRAIRSLVVLRQQQPDAHFSINLSGQTLSQTNVADYIIDELRRNSLDPSALIFEITETAAIADMPLAETFLRRLKTFGCRTALDDFGSGMSSFAYLRDLPVDFVKIDGRFVKNMCSNVMDQAMVRAMNDIAHALGKKTIAEYVETADCLKMLREYGVDYAQGFHLGYPDVIPEGEIDGPAAGNKVIYLRPR